uniref:UPAR/Ly6 domain-containing protein n=1 Tax=Cyprinus carpio TaxID=7962 RepID=A0A8C1KXE2_CYPCA
LFALFILLLICLSLLCVDISAKVKVKDCVADCASGSMNLGIVKRSSVCCNTDQCNVRDAPVDTHFKNSMVVKGCVSKSICDAGSSVQDVQGVSCCEGNLCNGAQSISQSFLFLCCSLLSFILLH